MEFSPEIRIAHIDTGDSHRGGQRQLLLLARGLRERHFEQVIVCPETSELNARARDEGFAVLDLPKHDLKHARGIRKLRRLIHERQINLLHAHDGTGHTIAWLASLGTPVRRVASRRVTFLPSRRIDYRLKYGYTCDAVIAVSGYIARLAESSGIPRRMIHLVYDGIELPCKLPDTQARQAARARYQLNDGDFVVGQLGAMAREKGQDLAIAAFEIVRNELPRARLILRGPDGGAVVIPGEALRPGRRDDTHQNLFEFFAALDLFIMPSRSEGLGSAALQAMSYGLPVLATRVGGLPEIVLQGKTGWLIEPESPRALADGIIAAASDPERLRAFGANAREWAKQFSADIMVEKTVALYEQLLNSRL